MTLTLHLSPRRIAVILALVAGILCFLSISLKAYEYSLPLNGSTYLIFQTVSVFNVNRESNIPSWYSSSLLLAAAGLLALTALVKHRQRAVYRWRWAGLSLIFLYLSMDEAAELHERFTVPIQEGLGTSGHLYFGWVVVGIAFALSVGVLYLGFFLHLERRQKALFFTAALLYVGGALGIESISANRWYQEGGTSLEFSAIGTLEELCEMLGAVVLIYALLSELRKHVQALEFTPPAPDQRPDGAQQ